jgi:hypothetical protein
MEARLKDVGKARIAEPTTEAMEKRRDEALAKIQEIDPNIELV